MRPVATAATRPVDAATLLVAAGVGAIAAAVFVGGAGSRRRDTWAGGGDGVRTVTFVFWIVVALAAALLIADSAETTQ
jgi:hypothetical protein